MTYHVSSGTLNLTKLKPKQYLTNYLWEFHHIYNFGAVANKDELIKFCIQNVRVTTRPDMVKKSLAQKCTFLAKAYQWTVPRQGPSCYDYYYYKLCQHVMLSSEAGRDKFYLKVLLDTN